MADSDDKTVVESIKSNFENLFMDRLSSPLIFSFAVSWCITNYQFFLILFTDAKFAYKVKLFHWYFYSPWYDWLIHSLLWPALAAYIYVYQWPKLNIKVIEHSANTKKDENAVRNRIAANELLTVEEVNRIHANHSKIVRQLKSEIQRLRDLEIQLTAELESKDAEQDEHLEPYKETVLRDDEKGFVVTDLDISETPEETPPEVEVLTQIEKEIILFIGEYQNKGKYWVSINDIQTTTKQDLIHTRVMLKNLVNQNILIFSRGDEYKLSSYGEELFTQITPT